jgi:hypothetical protein
MLATLPYLTSFAYLEAAEREGRQWKPHSEPRRR